MRSILLGLLILLLFLLAVPAANAATPTTQLPSLAVIVHAQPGGEALADPLRPLLEVETGKRYEGPLVERTELASMLREMKLSSLLGEASDTPVQAGKMEKAAFLVLARVGTGDVRLTVTGFPKTDIVLEKVYAERLEPESLAERIAADALLAVRSRNRDARTPYVSIGSIYCRDPHRRFLEFSRNTESTLRKQLGETAGLRLVERMFPSDLLNEFNLARGGMTVSQSIDFNAPPADLLLYGECTPQANQDLGNPAMLLDCTLTVVSPTNLLEPRSVTVVCRSNDSSMLVARAAELLGQAAVEAGESLAKGTPRGFSTQEFEEFKKQAFRLMPTPPLNGGVFFLQGSYRGSGQYGTIEELERALRMLECAMLFTGDDTTILTCAAAVLAGLSRRYDQLPAVKTALRSAATELTERAYLKESNWNTRGFYSGFGLQDERHEVARRVASHIWNTRTTEKWWSHMIAEAFIELIALEPDWQSRQKFILDVAPFFEKRERGLSTLSSAIFYYHNNSSQRWFVRWRNRKQEVTGNSLDLLPKRPPAEYAEVFIASDHPFLQAMGHMVAIDLATLRFEDTLDPHWAKTLLKHYRAAIALVPGLNELYKKDFAESNYTVVLNGYLLRQNRMLSKVAVEAELMELKEQYVLTQLRTENTHLSDVPNAMRQLLPWLKEHREDARAITLLNEFLKRYNYGGGGDYIRMQFTRALNELTFAKEKRPTLRSDQLISVAFDDGTTGQVRRLMVNRHGIFGVRDSQEKGRAFHLPLQSTRATVLSKLQAVHDIAVTDRHLVAGTWKNGLYVVDPATFEARQLKAATSGLPFDTVQLVADAGKDFYIGIPDKENLYTHIYRLDPEAGNITETDAKYVTHLYWTMKSGQGDSPVEPQTWNKRSLAIDGTMLALTASNTLDPSKNVTITREDGTNLLTYRGVELTYVFDFTMWQGHLVFATGNGLYVSKPGSNQLRCIWSEPDLLMLSCCVIDNRLYVGSSKGLHIIDAAQFAAVAGETTSPVLQARF